jgi:hypothetical protein
MNGAKPARTPAQPALPLAEDKNGPATTPGPGLSSLLQGQRPEEPCPPQPLTHASEDGRSGKFRPILTWTLLAADLFLVVLAWWLMTGGHRGGWGFVLAVAAVVLGGWLGSCAFLCRR